MRISDLEFRRVLFRSQNIRFQNREGELELAQTTSWGVSTRLIGGVIMTHGGDDGLRVPPIIAPQQTVTVPMLRDQPEDEDSLAYCSEIVADLSMWYVFGGPVRALLDTNAIKAAN